MTKTWKDIRKYFVANPKTGELEQAIIDHNTDEMWVFPMPAEVISATTLSKSLPVWEQDSSDQA